MLCEAAWTATRSPGPLRAFAHRVQARRGKNVAMVAVARKLCVIFWHLLAKREDYAFARPSLTAHKLRRLELRVGAQPQPGRAGPLEDRVRVLWRGEAPDGLPSPGRRVELRGFDW